MNKKFTLLELLIVISVIGLLITILMPSLGQARLKAQQAVCKSNLKQIGIGSMSYVNGNNGYLPSSAYKDAPHNYWRKQLYYLWQGVQFSHKEQDPILTQGAFKCPTSIESQFKTNQGGGYGWNALHIGNFLIGNANGKGTPIKLFTIEAPVETILAGDSREGTQTINDLRLLPPSHSADTIGTRHFFGVNLLWTDLHVSFMKRPSILAGKNGDQDYFYKVEK
jgi:type II secretory pathway pseudopilin PulG